MLSPVFTSNVTVQFDVPFVFKSTPSTTTLSVKTDDQCGVMTNSNSHAIPLFRTTLFGVTDAS